MIRVAAFVLPAVTWIAVAASTVGAVPQALCLALALLSVVAGFVLLAMGDGQ